MSAETLRVPDFHGSPLVREKIQSWHFDWQPGQPGQERIARLLKQPHCFLCQCPLPAAAKTREHIIPQWLLRRHGLATRSKATPPLSSLGQKARYADVVVPSCGTCNAGFLNAIERTMARTWPKSDASHHDVRKFSQCPHLAIWLAKILWAFRWAELANDVRHSIDEDASQLAAFWSANALVRRCAMAAFAPLKIRHQQTSTFSDEMAFRWPAQRCDIAASILVMHVQVPPEPAEQFDLKVPYGQHTLYIRAGSVAIAACFDYGAIKKFQKGFFAKFLAPRLHPMQSAEIAAHFIALGMHNSNYKSAVMRDEVVDGNWTQSIQLAFPIRNYSGRVTPDDFINALAFTWNVPPTSLVGEGGLRTVLEPLAKGRPPFIDISVVDSLGVIRSG